MELKELQHEVDDLEPRIERLKALYEQYFMGLEKTEPATLRRDVDRKLWQLRKIRIQNTALRYRLQMLIQRYNTYQQYWARVMREMERGTYRRDVLRAAKRIGSKEAMTIVGKRRAKMFMKLAAEQEARRGRATDAAAQQAAELEAALSGDSGGAAAQGAAPPRSGDASSPPSSLEDPSQWSFGDPPTGEWQRVSAAQVEDPPTAEWVVRRGEVDDDDDAPTLPPPAPLIRDHLSSSAAGSAQSPVTPFSTAGLAPPRVPSASAPPASGSPLPPPSAPSHLPPSSRRPLPPASPPPARPARRPSPAPPAAKAPRPAPAPAATRNQSSDRMRRLYDDYVKAKRRANEATDGLSLDKLERSLRKQTERLRQKHGDKQIDYEVVTQNGRPLIRPKIK